MDKSTPIKRSFKDKKDLIKHIHFIPLQYRYMPDLHKRVFGHITLKEIIGSQPPAIPDTQNLLVSELDMLLKELKDKTRSEILHLLQEQHKAQDIVNSRPGAMALAQNKIRLYNKYSKIYTDALSASMSNDDI